MKRQVSFAVIALLVVGGLAACSHKPTITATSTPTVAPTDTKLAGGIVCKPTTAVAHAPKIITQPTKTDPGRNGKFTLITNCGTIVITTDGVNAPVTLTNLTALAKANYFDGTLCHRLTTQGLYVLQCGDPTATGTGGPGFTFKDENLPKATNNNYPAGTVAMANAGPGTNGSQFFLVFADTTLGPNYTIWGQITSGLDIVKAVAAMGVQGGGSDGTPAQTFAIEKVTVS